MRQFKLKLITHESFKHLIFQYFAGNLIESDKFLKSQLNISTANNYIINNLD